MNTDKIYAERLASEYAPKTTRKIKALIRLDKWIKRPAKITAYIVGALSAMLLLVGMVFIALTQFLIGFIMVGTGIIGVSLALFLYQVIFIKRKNENATDVLLMAQEIIEEQ